MLNPETLGAVHTHTHTHVILNNIFLNINKNKDPCYGLRLLYLRI